MGRKEPKCYTSLLNWGKKNLVSFFKSYNLDKKVDIYKLKQEIGNLVNVEELERLKRGFPEIYQGLWPPCKCAPCQKIKKTRKR